MVVCFFAGTPSPYLTEQVGASTTVERVCSYAATLGNVERVAVLAAERVAGLPDSWEWQTRPSWDGAALLEAIAGLSDGPESVILFAHLDQPFLNVELTNRLLDRHARYHADYTFADGYPAGLAPEVVSGRALGYLRELAQGSGPVSRDTLFAIVQKDMNRFDIETELSRRDQRLLRLTLAVDTRANLAVCRALADGAPERIDEWPAHVEANRPAHRSLPRFVNVQVIEQEVQQLAYSPYPGVRPDVLAPGEIMAAGQFDRLVSELHAFSPEAVVSISLWGEVGLHPEVRALVRAVTSRPPLGLVVETSGVGWPARGRDALFADARALVIVGLDTNDPGRYREIRGNGFQEAVGFATGAIAAMGDRAHVQAVRSDVTEPTLESFYREWKARTDHVIIQKYDWFSGVLPDRRVGDLAPVVRFPCWHLQRDMTVLIDGRVPLCREDLKCERLLGNVFKSSIEAVWAAGREPYQEHSAGIYTGLCGQCDEYYTFNF